MWMSFRDLEQKTNRNNEYTYIHIVQGSGGRGKCWYGTSDEIGRELDIQNRQFSQLRPDYALTFHIHICTYECEIWFASSLVLCVSLAAFDIDARRQS